MSEANENGENRREEQTAKQGRGGAVAIVPRPPFSTKRGEPFDFSRVEFLIVRRSAKVAAPGALCFPGAVSNPARSRATPSFANFSKKSDSTSKSGVSLANVKRRPARPSFGSPPTRVPPTRTSNCVRNRRRSPPSNGERSRVCSPTPIFWRIIAKSFKKSSTAKLRWAKIERFKEGKRKRRGLRTATFLNVERSRRSARSARYNWLVALFSVKDSLFFLTFQNYYLIIF